MKPTRSTLCYRAVEFRAESTDGRTLEGYAAVFDQPTRIDSWEGEFDEVIRRGAFTKTLGERKPVLQFDHGRDARTGSVPIGSVKEIREDATGLFVRAELFENDVVEPIRQAIAGGAIDGMSFRFRVIQDEWDKGPTPALRTIREVELFELGPVVFPAYEGTTVGVRSLLAALPTQDREALVAELAAELRLAVDLNKPEAAPETSTPAPAAPETSTGLTPAECSAALRALDLRLGEVA